MKAFEISAIKIAQANVKCPFQLHGAKCQLQVKMYQPESWRSTQNRVNKIEEK